MFTHPLAPEVELRMLEPRNRRSRAIPKRLGFKREGTLRHVAKLNDRFIDHVVYSLLRDEWEAFRNT